VLGAMPPRCRPRLQGKVREEFPSLAVDHSSVGRRKATESAWLVPILAHSGFAGKGNGSLLFHAFHRKSSTSRERPVVHRLQVFVPELVDGESEFDGMAALFSSNSSPTAMGSTTSAKSSCSRDRRGRSAHGRERCRSHTAISDALRIGTIRDGKLVFNDIRQHVSVKRSQRT